MFTINFVCLTLYLAFSARAWIIYFAEVVAKLELQ